MIGVVELLIGSERAGITRFQSQLLARHRVNAVVEGDFQYLGSVQIPCEDIGFLAKSTHFNATRTTSFIGILLRLSLTNEFLRVGVRIEDRRVAVTLTNHFGSSHHKLVGCDLAYMDAQTWLQLMQFLLHLQNDIGKLVHRIVAILVDAADVDVGEVVVGAALQRRDAHFRRGRLVVELDPEAGNQFLRFFAG